MAKCLSSLTLDEEMIKVDRKKCRHYGNCGVGQQAIYLGSRLIDRYYYIPFERINRVYKVIAMSKGGYTGKGVFGSIPYLVVEYDNGKKSRTTCKYEDKVDALLADVAEYHPEIPVKSAAAEERLAKAEAERQARFKKDLSAKAESAIRELTQAEDYLKEKPMLSQQLSAASKAGRMIQTTKPTYKYIAYTILAAGAIAAGFGAYSLITKTGDFGIYFLLFGMSAILLFSGSNVIPTAGRNKRAVEQMLEMSSALMTSYVDDYPRVMGQTHEFPIPARYAHPASLERMIRSIKEGRAETVAEAFEVLKLDLKALNSSVQVTQEEYDEVVAIKPMFLLNDYQ